MIVKDQETPEHLRAKAQHLRDLARRWRDDLLRRRIRKGATDQRAAIIGALEFAREIERGLGDAVAPIEQRVVELRRLGLPFTAVARTLNIPVGSAKTIARRIRLGGAA